jgi:alcohol dehydrogenase class IV
VNSFRHIFPPLRIFSGPQSLKHLGAELERLSASRAVIVCGRSIAGDEGLIQAIREAANGRCVGTHPGVAAHSPLPEVEATARALADQKADAVIAVGGGSAVVTARAASILLAEQRDPRSLCTARDPDTGKLVSPKLLASKIPQIVIPTTPTTATVKAGSAMLDPVNRARLALFDPKTRAQAVIVDPRLLATPPDALVLSAGLNTLSLAVEALLSRSGDPFSDGLLIHAVTMLVDALPAIGSGTADPAEVRHSLMMASLLAGHGSDYTGAGLAIPIGHALSARFHLENGLANSLMLPHVIRFNGDHAPAGLAKLARALELPRPASSDQVAQRFSALFQSLGMPSRLRELGVDADGLGPVADIAMDDWFIRDNPRPIKGAAELKALLEQAW